MKRPFHPWATRPALRIAALALALATAPAMARGPAATTPQSPLAIPSSGVIGMDDAYLAPEFWIGRTRASDEVLLDRAAIEARAKKLRGR